MRLEKGLVSVGSFVRSFFPSLPFPSLPFLFFFFLSFFLFFLLTQNRALKFRFVWKKNDVFFAGGPGEVEVGKEKKTKNKPKRKTKTRKNN